MTNLVRNFLMRFCFYRRRLILARLKYIALPQGAF